MPKLLINVILAIKSRFIFSVITHLFTVFDTLISTHLYNYPQGRAGKWQAFTKF